MHIKPFNLFLTVQHTRYFKMAYLGTNQSLLTTAFGNLDVAEASTRFNLQFAYGINSQEVITTTTGSGTVTYSQPLAVCSTTAATSSSATLSSRRAIHYSTGIGGLNMFTSIFTTGVQGSTQIIGCGNETDGLFFGYNGAVFGVNRRYNGVDNWIPQTSWNVDKMDGTGSSGMTLIPAFGNVYKIQYQWLGWGIINFFIENPATGKFVLVHFIQHANANITPTLLNPTLNAYMQVMNTTNNTNISLQSASMAGFIEGKIINTGLQFSFFASKATSTTTNAIFTIQNNPTLNGITNRKIVGLTSLSLLPGNQVQTFTLTLNPILGGTPSYTNINATTSCVSYDTSSTTVTGGRNILTFVTSGVSGGGGTYIDLTPLTFELQPSDALTVAAVNESGGTTTTYASLNWIESY